MLDKSLRDQKNSGVRVQSRETKTLLNAAARHLAVLSSLCSRESLMTCVSLPCFFSVFLVERQLEASLLFQASASTDVLSSIIS